MPTDRRIILLVLLTGVAALPSLGARAQWPALRLHAIFPTGGQAGATLVVTVTGGEDLDELTALRFSHPGISAAPADAAPGSGPQFAVTIAPDVPAGDYEVRTIGAHGMSNPRRFVVSDRPERDEIEPNDAPEVAMPIDLETIVNARMLPERDVDCYRVSAQAGKTLVVECRAAGVDSRMSPWIEVWQDDRRLVVGWQPEGDDLYLPVRASHDGELILRVHDFEYAGGEDRPYRLRVSRLPCVAYAFPPALTPGEMREVLLRGWNLPGGVASDSGGLLESLAIDVVAPLVEGWSNPGVGVSAVSSGQSSWEFRPAWHEGCLRGVRFARSLGPLQAEREPNDDPRAAQPIAIPADVYGQFDRPGDVDRYAFTAPDDGAYWVEVLSDRGGFGADAVMRVARVERSPEGSEKVELLKTEDDAGENPGGRDFATRSVDPRFRLEATAGGEYRIGLRDLNTGSREGFVRRRPALYRLVVRRPEPDFSLVVLPEFPIQPEQRFALWSVQVRRGGTEKLKVVALRRDGFAGPIALRVEGLPAGVTCSPAVLGPGQDVTYLVFRAAEDAADWQGGVRVFGEATFDGGPARRGALAATVVWPGGEDRSAVSRTTDEIGLAVGDEGAFRVEPETPSLRSHQRRRWPLTLRLTRHEGFSGPVTLTAFNLPPNAKCDPVTIAEGDQEATVHLTVDDTPPGPWTILFRGDARLPKLDSPPEPMKKRGRKQQREIAEPAVPVQLDVLPGPLTLALAAPGDGQLVRGGAVGVTVTVARRNGFAGPVRLCLSTPAPAPGVSCECATLPADAERAVLEVHCAADAVAGPQPLAVVQAEVEFNGETVVVEQPFPLTIP